MTAIIEDYTPIYAGDTLNPFAPVLQHKDGSPVSLAGATLSMKMLEEDTGTVKICSGTWTIDDAVNGKAHYTYQAADVNTQGNWLLYVTITVGGAPVHPDPKPLVILPAP